MAVAYRAAWWPLAHARWACVLWNNALSVLFIHAMRDAERVVSFDMADGSELSTADSAYLADLCSGKCAEIYKAALAQAAAAGIFDPFWQRAGWQ